MIKSLFLKYSSGLFKLAWSLINHPRFGPLAWTFCIMFWVVFIVVPLPVKDKTGLEIVVNTYYEVWRQDANATSLFFVADEKEKLRDECATIRTLIYRTEQNKWSIMGSNMSNHQKAIEIAKIEARLKEHEKKLLNAEEDFRAISLSYKELLAKR